MPPEGERGDSCAAKCLVIRTFPINVGIIRATSDGGQVGRKLEASLGAAAGLPDFPRLNWPDFWGLP